MRKGETEVHAEQCHLETVVADTGIERAVGKRDGFGLVRGVYTAFLGDFSYIVSIHRPGNPQARHVREAK